MALIKYLRDLNQAAYSVLIIRWYLIGLSIKSMVVNQCQSMVLNDLWNLFMASNPTRWHPVTFSVQQNLWNHNQHQINGT